VQGLRAEFENFPSLLFRAQLWLVLKFSKIQGVFVQHILKSASSEYPESVPECCGKQTNFSRSCTALVTPTIGTTQNFKLHAHSIDNYLPTATCLHEDLPSMADW
jgi:hypothetical protein